MRNADLALRYPADWSRTRTAPAVPGLRSPTPCRPGPARVDPRRRRAGGRAGSRPGGCRRRRGADRGPGRCHGTALLGAPGAGIGAAVVAYAVPGADGTVVAACFQSARTAGPSRTAARAPPPPCGPAGPGPPLAVRQPAVRATAGGGGRGAWTASGPRAAPRWPGPRTRAGQAADHRTRCAATTAARRGHGPDRRPGQARASPRRRPSPSCAAPPAASATWRTPPAPAGRGRWNAARNGVRRRRGPLPGRAPAAPAAGIRRGLGIDCPPRGRPRQLEGRVPCWSPGARVSSAPGSSERLIAEGAKVVVLQRDVDPAGPVRHRGHRGALHGGATPTSPTTRRCSAILNEHAPYDDLPPGRPADRRARPTAPRSPPSRATSAAPTRCSRPAAPAGWWASALERIVVASTDHAYGSARGPALPGGLRAGARASPTTCPRRART